MNQENSSHSDTNLWEHYLRQIHTDVEPQNTVSEAFWANYAQQIDPFSPSKIVWAESKHLSNSSSVINRPVPLSFGDIFHQHLRPQEAFWSHQPVVHQQGEFSAAGCGAVIFLFLIISGICFALATPVVGMAFFMLFLLGGLGSLNVYSKPQPRFDISFATKHVAYEVNLPGQMPKRHLLPYKDIFDVWQCPAGLAFSVKNLRIPDLTEEFDDGYHKIVLPKKNIQNLGQIESFLKDIVLYNEVQKKKQKP